MNNEETKKKIVDILDNKQTHGVSLQRISVDGPIKIVQIYTPNEDIADALIAAGIGDVKEAQHRAEVAELALKDVCTNVIKDEEDDIAIEPRARVLYKAYLRQAEKELEEERNDK